MISDYYTRIVDVLRLMPVSGGLEDYQTHLTGIGCLIQPLEESVSADLQGSFGKDFLMFTDAVNDILEGDAIIDGETQYRVVGQEKFDVKGRPRHQELRIRYVKVVKRRSWSGRAARRSTASPSRSAGWRSPG